MFGVSEEDVRSRERNYFDVDTHAVHIFDTFRDISHRGRDAKKPRATVSDDCLSAGTRAERKLRRQISNRLKEWLGVEVRMKIKLHFVFFVPYVPSVATFLGGTD